MNKKMQREGGGNDGWRKEKGKKSLCLLMVNLKRSQKDLR